MPSFRRAPSFVPSFPRPTRWQAYRSSGRFVGKRRERGVSLTSFLDRNPQVGRSLGMLLRPVEGQDPIMGPTAAPIGSKNPPLSGTAVDYMLRFELERRFPQAWTDQWIAERGEQILRDRAGTDGVILKFDPKSGEARQSVKLSKRAHQLVVAAMRSHRRFVHLRRPSQSDFKRMAHHSVLLAKLDGAYRGRSLKVDDLGIADEDVVEDVLAMLGAVPNDGALGLPEGEGIWLNPSFGPYSALVGGADADLGARSLTRFPAGGDLLHGHCPVTPGLPGPFVPLNRGSPRAISSGYGSGTKASTPLRPSPSLGAGTAVTPVPA